MRRTFAAGLSVVLVGSTVGVAPARAATPLKVTLDKTSVAVSSLNTVPVTVTVEGSYEDTQTVYVQFKRISGTGPANEFSSMPLQLVDGDGTPGVWRGTANVPSTLNGTIEPAAVDVLELVQGQPTSSPAPVANPPALVVNGVHVPKFTSVLTPAVVPYDKPWSVRYTVIDSQTGKPYGTRLKLWFGIEERCLEANEHEEVLSDTSGNFTRSFPANRYGDWTSCMKLPGKPGGIARLVTRVKRPAAISAAPSKTSAPVGTIVPVNGIVVQGNYCQVALQRLYGATAWRTVSTTKVRISDRFTLNAQPAYKGNISYRAYLPPCYDKVAGSTKPFIIRGT